MLFSTVAVADTQVINCGATTQASCSCPAGYVLTGYNGSNVCFNSNAQQCGGVVATTTSVYCLSSAWVPCAGGGLGGAALGAQIICAKVCQ